jgi:hypothetical protein
VSISVDDIPYLSPNLRAVPMPRRTVGTDIRSNARIDRPLLSSNASRLGPY